MFSLFLDLRLSIWFVWKFIHWFRNDNVNIKTMKSSCCCASLRLTSWSTFFHCLLNSSDRNTGTLLVVILTSWSYHLQKVRYLTRDFVLWTYHWQSSQNMVQMLALWSNLSSNSPGRQKGFCQIVELDTLEHLVWGFPPTGSTQWQWQLSPIPGR